MSAAGGALEGADFPEGGVGVGAGGRGGVGRDEARGEGVEGAAARGGGVGGREGEGEDEDEEEEGGEVVRHFREGREGGGRVAGCWVLGAGGCFAWCCV